jgi:hypothetical protein
MFEQAFVQAVTLNRSGAKWVMVPAHSKVQKSVTAIKTCMHPTNMQDQLHT